MKRQQPQTPEDIVRVLGALSEPVLQSVIEEKSKAMDFVWPSAMALDPLGYASRACVAGCADVIRGLRGVDWDRLSDVTILNAARAHDPENPKGHPEAICALIDLAIADGQGAKAMAMTRSFNPKSLEPLQEIVSKNMEAVLVKYLDHGLSANEPLGTAGLTLFELCQLRNPSMLNVIRSHSARRTAHSLIDEILQTSHGNTPSP